MGTRKFELQKHTWQLVGTAPLALFQESGPVEYHMGATAPDENSSYVLAFRRATVDGSDVENIAFSQDIYCRIPSNLPPQTNNEPYTVTALGDGVT